MDNLDYLMGRVRPTGTSSSTLVSSSQYLNHPAMREWIGKHYLRKNGPDRGSEADVADGLIPALLELTEPGHVETLILAEREKNPAFRAWIDEAYIAPHSAAFFAGYPPGSFGAIYHDCLTRQKFQVNLGRADFTPTSHYEFMRFRIGQVHDFEHIITGGGFNTLGELLPYFTRLTNTHRHLSPELAAEVTKVYVMGGYRHPVRAGLHYPQVYLTVLDLMQRGIRIGMESGPIFMARFEDVLHLTPAEAREALGVRHAEHIDTEEASRIYDDRGEE